MSLPPVAAETFEDQAPSSDSSPVELTDEAAFLAEWRARRDFEQKRSFPLIGIPCVIVALLSSMFSDIPSIVSGLRAVAAAQAILIIVGIWSTRVPTIGRRRVTTGLFAASALMWLLTIGLYAHHTANTLIGEALAISAKHNLVSLFRGPLISAFEEMGASSMVFILACAFGTLLIPMRGVATLVILGGMAALSGYVFSGHTDPSAWYLATGCVLALGGTYSWRVNRRDDAIALLELEKRRLVEKATLAKFERELELARAIQRSALPPERQPFGNGAVVDCYQITHHRVGGDWMAVRELEGGRKIVLIADATGKGIQAALIVHAVQSLWARSLDQPEFDAKTFIEEVDKTLTRLGTHASQSMTMAIADIRDTQVEYWAAGHPHLWVFVGNGDPALDVHMVNARGNMVGLGLNLQLKSKTLALPPDEPIRLVMATDGIFDGLAKPYRKSLGELLAEIERTGLDAIEKIACDDDKTLVIVRRESLSTN